MLALDFVYICIYLDDLFVISNVNFEEHIQYLTRVQQKVSEEQNSKLNQQYITYMLWMAKLLTCQVLYKPLNW